MRLDVFRLIERRFNGDAALKLMARRIYRGFAAERVKSVRPYVEVTETGSEQFDSFDADIERIDIDMTVETKGRESDKCDKIVGELMRVFKDFKGSGGVVLIAGMERAGRTGPKLEDGVYRATLSYQCWVEWKQRVPSARAGI